MVVVVCCDECAVRYIRIDSEARACGTTERAVSADGISNVSAKVDDIFNSNASARNGLGEDFFFKRKRMWIFCGGNAGLKLKGSGYGVGRSRNDQILEGQIFHL